MDNFEQTISTIKGKAYWEINIRPTEYIKHRVDKRQIIDILKKSVVELRGWDYPHIDQNEPPTNFQDGVENYVNWNQHKEFWRLTDSLNFYHLLALREDWTEKAEYHNMWSSGKELEGKMWIGIMNTLYTITEIFEFGKRLALNAPIDNTIYIDIKAQNINNHILIVDDYRRTPLFQEYNSGRNVTWENEIKEYRISDFLNSVPNLAFEAFKDFTYLFGWNNIPEANLKDTINNYLIGKIG